MTHSYRFNVPQNRIKRLSTWKKKQGPFQKLTDVLEVDGLSVKVLEKLCEDIITNKTNILVENIGTTYNKSRKQFLVPALTYEQIEVCLSISINQTIYSTYNDFH